jgi:hypothetical protein
MYVDARIMCLFTRQINKADTGGLMTGCERERSARAERAVLRIIAKNSGPKRVLLERGAP